MSSEFDSFLDRMAKLSYRAIIREANAEFDQATAGHKQRVKEVRRGYAPPPVYPGQIRNFLFFIQSGMKPSGAPDEEFREYERVARALVERGEWKSDALHLFRKL